MVALKDLLSREGLEDPAPIYRELLSEGPEALGRVVASHGEVTAVLADRRLSSERIATLMAALPEAWAIEAAPVGEVLERIVAFLDPPDHTRVRRLLMGAFKPGFVRAQAPLVERLVGERLELVEAMARDSRAPDMVTEFMQCRERP